jgi:hypothetical protein
LGSEPQEGVDIPEEEAGDLALVGARGNGLPAIEDAELEVEQAVGVPGIDLVSIADVEVGGLANELTVLE